MTDKQIICAEIEKLRKEYDIDTTPIAKYQVAQAILNRLSGVLDSLQEEPKFKVGDTLKKKDKDYTFMVDRIQGGYYHNDHNNGAFFPIEDQDQWELVEEPVIKDFEMALAEMIDKAQKNVIEPLVVAAQWKDELIELAKSEEPVSDDWEEAARRYAALQAGMKDAMTSDFYDEYPYSTADVVAFKAGANWKKQQMMKDAVDTEVTYGKSLAIPSLGYALDKKGLDYGDKVKVIIVKED